MERAGKGMFGRLADSVFKRIDVLCGVDARSDYDLAIKFRMLMLVSAVSFLSVSNTLYTAFSLSSEITVPKIVGLFTIAVILSIPVLIITTKRLMVPAIIFCMTAMGGITAALVFNGGLESHFIVNLPLVSVVAGWLINMRAGFIAGAVTIAIFLFLGSDWAPLLVTSTALTAEQVSLMRMSNAITTTISALVVVRCFQLATTHAIADAREAQANADRANRAKSVFLANMSHELRTPLNGVIAVTGTLKKTTLTQEQDSMVDLVASSGRTLERLLSDVLDVSKIEAGRLEIENIPFDFRETIQETADLFQASAVEKGIEFSVTFGPNLNKYLVGDPTRMRQVLSNLLSNAVKFTSHGSIFVHAFVDQSPSGRTQMSFSVRDTGIGFDAALVDDLFNPFTQEDGSINRRFGGTGLGLFICKSLVHAMGGEIKTRSNVGKGATFTVVIPTEILEQDVPVEKQIRETKQTDVSGAVLPQTARDERTSSQGNSHLKILLVEDHVTNRKIVELILGPLDVELTSVENGEEAIAAFRSHHFDLILMDMQMPVMDGLAATREIRRIEADAQLSRTPIAMLTANAMETHIQEALDAGADKHIAKPVTPDSLIGSLSDLLEERGMKGLVAA